MMSVQQENTNIAPRMRPYGYHLLICEHGDCAEPEAAMRLHQHFREVAQAHGLNKLRNPDRVKCKQKCASSQSAFRASRIGLEISCVEFPVSFSIHQETHCMV